MNSDSALMRLLWPLLAALAGAVTALSFRPFKRMSALEIGLSLGVGTSFATFVGPLAVAWIFSGATDPRMEGAVYYLMATGSNILIPIAVRKLAQLFGATIDGDGQ